MHDIKSIRQNPEAFDAGLARRGLEGKSKEILALDIERREMLLRVESLKKQKNELATSMGKVQGKPTPEQLDNIKNSQSFGRAIKEYEDKLPNIVQGMNELLSTLPNLPADDVPNGKDEHDNKELRVVGTKPTFSFAPKQHDEIGEKLGLMDFEGAAKLSGARFVVLKGALARMERALASMFLDMNVEAGYTEMAPPFLVKSGAMFGTGQLPKFENDLYRIPPAKLPEEEIEILDSQIFESEDGKKYIARSEHKEFVKKFDAEDYQVKLRNGKIVATPPSDDFWLIPTAEVPLTNLVSDTIIEESKLPIRMTAYTPCFRSEAGSAGKDTRGMIRQHQFSKVEMVSITTPEQSQAEHERMTGQAEAILQKLGLAYRVVLLCSGDMGFSAEKTYDIEVWMPGQDAFREISSCSNCGAFQARRMKARFKREKENIAVHTLNGSGLPIGRTMVAIIENYQNEDGSIRVPEALQPYMGGLKVIS